MRIRIIKVPKQYKDGGTLDKEEINPGLDAMVKARLALDSHFGNPTARRMTNYDTRSYTFPDGRRGNVYVGSYGNYVIPQIQDVNGELKFIEDPLSDENRERSKAQSMKFENPRDAEYFAKNYKRFAPMMSLYSKGGMIQNAKKWHHAFGGNLMTHGADFSNGMIFVGNGGSHEENPFEGVPMGVDQEGTPNLVEEGETIFNDYVFSKRLMVPKAIRNKYKLGGTKNLSFADASKQLAKESEERPNDPISKAGLEANMIRLMEAQEELREATGKGNKFSRGGKMGRLYAGLNTDPFPNVLSIANRGFAITPFDEILGPTYVTGGRGITEPTKGGNLVNPNMPYVNTPPPVVNDIEGGPVLEQMTLSPAAQAAAKESKINRNVPGEVLDRIKQAANRIPKGMDYLRFAQVFSQAGQHLKDSLGITNRPDFALGRKIREANSQVRGISTRAAGQKLGYTPDDEWAAINNFNSQMAAQRSALRNAGNRVGLAGQLLASAYNQNRALGALYSGMGKANWEKLTQTVAHNTSVDQANRAAELQAAQADASQGNIRAQNLINAARADDAEESAYAQARAANRDNFYNTLGALGKERIDRAMLEGLINSGLVGTPNEAMLTALNYLGINPTVKKSKGGRINRKRRGLTY